MRSVPFILVALFLPLMACGQSAPPAPWIVYYQGGEVIASVDTSRIARAERGLELWLRFDTTPSQMPDEPGQTYTRTEVLQHVDCAGDRVDSKRMRLFDREGKLISDEATQTRWNTISTHPWSETFYPALCEWLARRESR